MELVNQIRSNFPKTIDKGKPIFSALIANDKGDAAIQKQLVDLLAYMKEWTSTPDVYNQSGLMLEKTITFFSYLERFADETEQSLKNRFRAIFVRNHDTRWGTPYDVKSVFRQYFPHAEIYLIENVNKIDSVVPGENNYIVDGDISTSTPSDWTLTNCSATKAARFSKGFGIEMNQNGGSFSQTVTIPNRKQINDSEEYKNLTYFLHFFMSGKVDVQIHNSANNKYWDYTLKEWKTTATNNRFEQAEWNDCSLYFFTDGDDDTTDITVTFNYVAPDIAAEVTDTTIKGLLPVTWTIDNCTTTDNIINMEQDDSEVSTTTNVVPKTNYSLKFAHKGKLALVIQNDNNKYWDITSQEWKSTQVTNIIRAVDWTNRDYTIIPDSADTTISVSFAYVDSNVYLQDAEINGEIKKTETLTNCTTTGKIINLEQMTSKASYVLNVQAGEVYDFKYFFLGRMNIIVKNDNNEYWDFNSNAWESTQINNEYLSNKLIGKDLRIVANASTTQLTIEFTLIQSSYLDYFRLFQKQAYSSFTVIAHFTGNTSMGAFGLAAGDSDPNNGAAPTDPVPQPRYSNYGYYEKSFLSGVPIGFASDIYEDLLDYLRSQGVKAFLDIVVKDA